jgi:poly-gamma-glutamate synthesis protein (capsule biosynthesis protein)
MPSGNCSITLFFCGDVMTGRGIDQILRSPGDPQLHEPCVKDAREYVRLAEAANGPIPRQVGPEYVWGVALDEFRRIRPDVRIVNLETSITTSSRYWPDKSIHYRMNPENVDCLRAAGINCCTLANNHVLDWGYEGLRETLTTLEAADIQTAGAGRNLQQARRPAMFELPGKGRVLVIGIGSPSGGIPVQWAASDTAAGVSLIDECDPSALRTVQNLAARATEDDCVTVASIHWGPNWGYEIPRSQRDFAHALVDHAGTDIVFGHSSHHVKGFEVYRERLIVYGAGDLLTDYEGISGHESYRGDLGLMYFVTVDSRDHRLVGLELVPTQVRQFQIRRPSEPDALHLAQTLQREIVPFGLGLTRVDPQRFALR